jgi:catechol 2,3-dioxygenase-like lactoylglutathione lyase family enzyme
MNALFRRAAGYQGDALRLPVKNVDQALPFYEERLGFHIVERQDEPLKSAILERDGVRIGLVESSGDPTQDGSFFEVSDVDAVFADLKGRGLELGPPEIQRSAHGAYKSFFVVAPDGLCYMVGERVL